DRILRKIGVLHLKDTSPDPTFRVLEISEAGMRVVADTSKPAASGAAARGSVLESQDERAQRLRLILQIATERLKLNPGDADALFAMAAAQATLDDAKGGLETLDRLAALDSAYPGLWVLKTKLHAKLGQADLARQSRMRAQQIEKTPSKRGLTNGLALGRRGASKAGRTNGLRGRTNGLRGRTNGLTNGLGRTNGLTNGLGRTNGLTNGLGRTNGLTNGLGRTN